MARQRAQEHQWNDIKVGDLIAVGSGDAEQGGRVTARHNDKVEVELYDRPGLRFWYAVPDVRLGAARPRPVMMANRYPRKEQTVEVRAVCPHLNLADLCPDCREE
jgi:hypothetical protein